MITLRHLITGLVGYFSAVKTVGIHAVGKELRYFVVTAYDP